MIGRVGGDDATISSHCFRHAQSNVVGFRTRAGEDRRIESIIHRPGQALDIFENTLMQIAGVGIQRARLFMDGFNHARVAVADMGNVVVAIEIFASFCVPQIRSPGRRLRHRDQRGVCDRLGVGRRLSAEHSAEANPLAVAGAFSV